MIQPCFGGILSLYTTKHEAFTGGSNLIGKYLLPLHNHQHRPAKFGDQDSFHKTLQSGIELKLPGPKDKGALDFSIVLWFQTLSSKMV